MIEQASVQRSGVAGGQVGPAGSTMTAARVSSQPIKYERHPPVRTCSKIIRRL
jgi:hypothetical protein